MNRTTRINKARKLVARLACGKAKIEVNYANSVLIVTLERDRDGTNLMHDVLCRVPCEAACLGNRIRFYF